MRSMRSKKPGQAPFDAVINAAVSRLSVVIMFGLTLGTVITMVLLPTVYSLLFGIRNPDVSEGSDGGTLTPQVA